MIYIDDEGNARSSLESETPKQLATPTPTPASSSTPAQPAEDPGILDYALDIPKGAYNGVIGAVQETGQFAWDVLGAVPGRMQDDKMPGYETLESFKAHTQTQVGKVTESVSQIATGILGAGKFIKTAGLLRNSGAVAKGLLSGAVADAVVMDPLEARLSNLVESYPELSNPLTEALAAKPDDTRWEGRLKNAVEGMGFGLAVEKLFMGCAKALRAMRSGDDKALQQLLPELEAAQPKISGKGVPEAAEAAEGVPAKVARVADEAPVKSAAEPPPHGTTRTPFTEEEMRAIGEKAAANTRTAEELMSKGPELLNTHRLSILDAEGLALHEALCKTGFKRTILAEGRKTLEELTGKNLDRLKESGFNTTKLEEMVARTDARTVAGQQAREELFIVRSTYDTVIRECQELGTKLTKFGGTEQEAARHQVLLQILGDLYGTIKNAGTEAGRTLVSFRRMTESFGDILKVNDEKLLEKAITKHVKEGRLRGSDKWLNILKDSRFAEISGTPKALTALAEGLRSKKFSDYFTEWYMNSILSGIRTHLTNTTSNAAKTFLTPLSRVGGHLMPGKEFSIAAAKQEAVAFGALKRNADVALRFALKAFKEDRTILEGGSAQWLEGMAQSTKAWSAENVRGRHLMAQLEKGVPIQEAMQMPQWKEVQASIFEAAGKVINLPGRFLKAEDEFFKQLAYRTDLETRFMAEAMEKYPRASSTELGEIVARRVEESFDAAGRGVDKAGLTEAKRVTWTTDLREGSLSKGVQDISNSNPFIKLVLPFVRTPSNLVADAFDHIPIVAQLAARNREALRAGGREAARVKGQQALGGLMISSFAMMAVDGTITGSAPVDAKAREALKANGWQENSLRIGGTYISMNRADPFAMLLTATANFVNAAPYLDEDHHKEMAATLMASTMRLIGDKSYMKSIGDLVDAAQGDERALGRLTRGIVTGFTTPNLIREARQGYDDVLRDINTIEGAVLNSIPGFSGSLPAKHDWLTGKPVAGGLAHLFGISPINEDSVAYELAVLGGVYKGLPYEINKVQLTAAQHSRYCELMGTIKLNGKNLHQTLNTVIHSRDYDLGRKTLLKDDDRSNYLNKIITAYRKAAGYALLQEEPTVISAAENEGRTKKKKEQLIKPPSPTRPSSRASSPTPQQQRGADALAALLQ